MQTDCNWNVANEHNTTIDDDRKVFFVYVDMH